MPGRRRATCGAIVGLFVLSACATEGEGSLQSETAPPPTVAGVGYLPEEVPTTTIDPDADPSEIVPDVVVTRPVDEDGAIVDQVADLVAGNRVIAIGDSILASTASRFGREMCDGLEELGWAVEVNAEPGRFVPFGNNVLDRRLPDEPGGDDDWDAAVVHLGSNYGLDQDAYREELDEILSRLSPRPTLLLTVTVYRPAWAEVNDVIAELAEEYDNVIVVDWERTARAPGVLSRDGLHPGDAGEQVLVDLIAAALGELPGAEPECLRSQFTDDSQIGGGGGVITGRPSGGGSSGSGSSGRPSGGGSGGGTTGGSGGTTTVPGGDTGGSTDGGTDTTGGTDDGGTGTTGGTDDGGSTDGGSTDGGDGSSGGTDGGSTDGGSTDGGDGSSGGTDGGSTDGGSGSTGGTDGGSTDGGSSGGGSTDGGSTDGGSTDGGSSGGSDGGSTGGGSTDGGSTDGGSSGGGSTDGGSTDGGSTDGGSTDAGSTDGGP